MIEMIGKAFRYFVLFIFNPLWYLQLLIRRDKNLWIFGSWYGQKYSDNSKFFFEYLLNNSDVSCVWITKNVEVYKMLTLKGIPCEMHNSLKGVLISLKAGRVIVSSGKEDVNNYLINGAIIINTWHGVPIKRIALDDEINVSKFNNLIQKLLYPFIWEYNLNAIVSTSPFFDAILARAFGLNIDQVLLTGYPRNDVFFEITNIHPFVTNLNNLLDKPRLVFYLPTFRSGYNVNLFDEFNFDFESWQVFLQNSNTVLLFKTHYADKDSKLDSVSERIIFVNDNEVGDLNTLLKEIDILITDYSGVYFDFLLTGKPIVFAPFDLEKYVTKSRSLYFDYKDIVCGPVVKDWIETEKAIKELIKNDIYIDIRKNMNNKFNKYQDSLSSARLYNEIKNL